MKLIFSAIITVLLLAALTVVNDIGAAKAPVKTAVVATQQMVQIKDPVLSIVRLHNLAGEFFCSGVVVGKTTIITAAHCVVEQEGMIEIRDHANKRYGTYATVAGSNQRADYAILHGNFRRYPAMGTDTDPKTILAGILNDARQIIACGFPWSGDLFCTPVTHRQQFNFGFAGQGFLYPGMSGGPVIDEQTGKVIGVNSAVNGGFILVSPIIEIYKALDVKPE